MQALVNINPLNSAFPVSARELHEFLEVNTRFDKWIQRRIEQYDLIENVDYESLAQNWASVSYSGSSVPNRRIEYSLTIDCAKELCMIENNAKGKEARRYFIECEKAYRRLINPMEGMKPLRREGYEYYEYRVAMQQAGLPHSPQHLAAHIQHHRNQFYKDITGAWLITKALVQRLKFRQLSASNYQLSIQ
jgi:phage anti-repressor protein